MLLTVFEKYIFLQSLGWGIANSLWQVALLWMMYKLVTVSAKNVSALFKYHFSLMLLFASFAWFASTTFQNYIAIKNAGNQMAALSWLNVSQNFISSLQWLSVAYFIVLTVQVFLFAKKINSLFSLKKSGFIKAPVDIRLFTEQTAFHIGIKKKVSIWLSEKAGVPSVIGFFKPIILLPVTALNNLTTAQAEAIILHELAHIKRHDYLVNFIQCFIEMILFFNPFAKLLGNAARKERENCCDDWVMNYQYNQHDYASALLILEQNRFTSIHFALAATNGKKNLLNRVKRLFADEPKVSFSFLQKIKLVSVFCSILLMVFFVLPIREHKTAAIEKQESPSPLFASANILPANYTETKKLSIIINDKPLPVKVVKEKRPAKKVVVAEAPEEVEYNTALINEELLNPNEELQNVAIQTAGVEEFYPVTKVIIQIEEEQSGAKDKKTYLVELKNNNGSTEVKPLIMLNKKVKELTKKAKEKLTTSSKKTVAKKRTTA
jgi:beta-lactamase regulating signal transducer with metallopeptidase domain